MVRIRSCFEQEWYGGIFRDVNIGGGAIGVRYIFSSGARQMIVVHRFRYTTRSGLVWSGPWKHLNSCLGQLGWKYTTYIYFRRLTLLLLLLHYSFFLSVLFPAARLLLFWSLLIGRIRLHF